jgi:uncharacterized repeat protein (TIGR01451 family)/MYXO-CTERM domain-containing protein
MSERATDTDPGATDREFQAGNAAKGAARMIRSQVVVSKLIVSLAASLVLGAVLLSAGCGDPKGGAAESTAAARAAVFINGDLEADAVGASPSGWATSTNINPLNTGITDTRPAHQTFASLNLQAGGYSGTLVVGGATESQSDPDLGTAATLRFPKYGTRAVRVNYLDATNKGTNENVNQLSQSMITSNGDVDPSDNKVHVRFAVAPVLQSGGHPYNQQPYYFVELDNLTKGTILYQDFNASAQDGVPWQIETIAGADVYYTNWQLVDIAPGNSGLAVGDQVKLTVIASGCSQGGHYGRVYVDGLGSTIPGIYTSATGPSAANDGTNITYVVSYKNGGTATAVATQLNMVIPSGTTFQSTNLSSACSGVAAGATGTLSCALGDLAAGGSGSFTVTVNLNGGTAGTTVTNGNYSIQATGVSALLGPKVLTSVTSAVIYADVSITKSDGAAAVGGGQALTYTIVASNAGPGAASSVNVADTMPAQLIGATWSCAGSGGGTCLASGAGDINDTAALPVGASVTYSVHATVMAGLTSGSVINSVTATVGGGAADPDTSNNTAVDTDSIGVLRTLSVTKTNSNGGSVTSSPASIACGTSCSSASGQFVDGTSLVLTASPVSGASFTGWGGACAASGSSPTCSLTMTGDQSVTAAFTPPPTVNITSGNNQGAALGAAFASPLTVHVLDSAGNPIVGGTVVFSVPGSGASVVLSAASATTNASGFATVTATANATAGAYAVVAGLSGTPTTAAFSLWNYGVATTISVVSGNGQSAVTGVAFAPLTVLVRDAASQPVPNVSVAFGAPAAPGATAVLGGSPATTDAAGHASAGATAGQTAGGYSVTATASGVAAPATFTLTNLAGAAASIIASGGSPQTTLIGSGFTLPLVVTVRDAFGNPVSGVAISFSPPVSGASASLIPASGTTNGAGQLSVAAAANGTVGAYAVGALAAGVAAGTSFALSNFGPLAINPTAVTLAPRAGQTFTASGDPTAVYTYAVVTNSSGGSVVPATGVYTAGSGGGTTDTVQVTDSKGRSATASVTVGPGVSISPSPFSTAPRGFRTFTASGGSGTGYSFALTTNHSGGSLIGSVYTAGSTGSVSDTLTVTDSLGNSASLNIVVGAAVSLSPLAPGTTPKGMVTLTASGGSGASYVYAITTNRSGATIDAAGNYVAGAVGGVVDTIAVTDSLGNTASTTVTVTAGVSLAASGLSTPPRGPLTFTASGGTAAGFTFTLATNASGGSIDPVTGAYLAGNVGPVTDKVTVTDSLGNVASANVAVGPGVSLTPLLPSAPPRGPINLVASGGSGTGFVFTLVTNASGASIDAATGLFTAGGAGPSVDRVRATDSLGNFAEVAISVGAGLTINPSSPTLVPHAAQVFSAMGGSGTTYSYALSTNSSGGSIDPVTGAYLAGSVGGGSDVVTVTDSLGNTATATITLGPSLALNPPLATLAPLGTLTFSVSGGSGAGYVFALGAAPSGGAIDAGTGAYQAGTTGGVGDVVTVTDSLGNVASAPVTITDALQPVAGTVSLAPLAGTTLAVTGGASGYRFALTLSGSGGSVDPITGAYLAGPTGNTDDLITVTDQFGATTTISINIGPGVSLDPATPATAPRGAITFSASGGSAMGYVYSLASDLSGGSIDPGTGVYTAGPTSSVVDVVSVVDSLGNTASVNVAVGGALSINPAAPVLAPLATITFSATGGSGLGLSFALSDNLSGGSIDATTGVYVAGPTPNVADTVTVTDSLGNSATAQVAVSGGVMLAPAASTVAPRGAVILSASGGSGTGFVFTLTTNNSGGTVDPATGSYTAGATPAVTDTVTVTDSLGNTATATITVGAGLNLTAPSSQTPPRGSLALTASGGSGDYTFEIRTNGSGASVVSTSGLYTAGVTPSTTDLVEVTDDLGNSQTLLVTVTAGITIAPAQAVVPPGGSLAFTASGGSGSGYAFALSTNGSGGTLDAASGAYLAGNTTDITDVVTVVDSLGNTASVSIAIGDGVTLNPPTASVPPRGRQTFAAFGGSGTGYMFSMVTSASGGSIDPSSGAYHAGIVPNVTDTVRVVDSLGKSATAQVMVGPGITVTPSTASLAPAGTLELAVSGGSGTGFTFTLGSAGSGGTVSATRGDYAAGATGGATDVVTVTDSLGNSAVATITVTASLSLAPAESRLPPRGTLRPTVTGGATPYAFVASSNRSGASVNPSTGEYVAGAIPGVDDQITVRDANGVSQAIIIHVGPGVSITPANPVATAGTSLALSASGGSGSGYTWRVVSGNAGGAIDAASGKYTASHAPPVGAADLVEAADSLGNTARVTVNVSVINVSAAGGSRGCSYAGGTNGSHGAGLLALVGLLAIALHRRRSRR